MVRTARYLVTGGAGFIGSHIADALLREDADVRIFDDFSSGKERNLRRMAPCVEIARGDVRDGEALRRAMDGVAVVFHLAAVSSVRRSVDHPIETSAVNITGTERVLLAARDAGVRRVVYASSAAIYGDSPAPIQSEDALPAPMSPYAVHKLTGEHLCRAYAHLYGLETVALRFFNVFGPRQDPDSEYASVIPRFLAALTRGERPTIYGDGEQTRDFVAIENIVAANLLAATTPGISGAVMNIGSGAATSLLDALRILGELSGAEILPIFEPARVGDIRDSMASIQRARDLLGYEPRVTLREGLSRTLAAWSPRAGVEGATQLS
ncbi:MAG: SDR family oxidoreductase [Ktedonobacterales bacterium]